MTCPFQPTPGKERGTIWFLEAREGRFEKCVRLNPNSSAFRQGIDSFSWPGEINVINPPHTQVRQAVSFRLGAPLDMMVGAPVTQGAGVFGTQGMGVSAPCAAAVADAVAGNPSDRQGPNGGMFTSGL